MDLRKIILLFSFLAMFSTLLGGYSYFSSALNIALEKEHEKAEDIVKTTKTHIASQINARQKETKLLADNDIVKKALAGNGSTPLSTVNSILDRFQKNLDVSVCYLMDDQGLTIASSNRNTEKSFVGKNYGFRPYFKQAIQGQPSVYLALGVTSGKRGIYYSHPIYIDTKDKPVGVAVIKASAEHLLLEPIDKIQKGILLLHDPNGLIFLSSHKDWLFKFIWKTSPDVLAEMGKGRQFGNGPWPWVGMIQNDEDHSTDANGKKYLVHQETFEALPGWKLSHFLDLSSVSENVYGPLLRTVGIMVLLLCLVMGSIIVFLYKSAHDELRKRKIAEEERERLIAELSSALAEIKTLRGIIPICSHCKKIRDDKGYWNQIELYIRDHSEAEFSHGICPDCEEKLYPDYVNRKKI